MVAPSSLWSPRVDVSSAPVRVLCYTTDLRRWNAVRVDRDDVVIGRDPESDILVDAPSLSRFHARIGWSDGEPELEDLLSRNGSFHHGQRLRTFRLREGDAFRLGSVLFFYTRDPLRAVLPDGRRVAYLDVQKLSPQHQIVGHDDATTMFSPGTTTMGREALARLMKRDATWQAGTLIAEGSGQRWRLGTRIHRLGWRTEISVGGWAFGGWTGRGHGAVIEWMGGAHRVRTTAWLASVQVNGADAWKRRLRHGDRIAAGGVCFRYLVR